MAETEYITRDEFRAEMAEFRAEIRTELAAMRVDLAAMRVDMARRLPTWAFFGGLAGGLIAAAAKIFG